MHWYYPRTPTLREMQPATWAPWLREVQTAPPVTFDRSAALALIGHAYRALVDEALYVDDPGPLEQREGPTPALPPGHALHAFEVTAGWRWERPAAPEQPWWLDDDPYWWFDLPPEVVRAEEGNRLQVPVGSPMLELPTGTLAVGPHVIGVVPQEDPDGQEPSEVLDETVVDLTGFVGVDEHGLLLGPFPCPTCRGPVWRGWAWAVGEPLECDACGTDVFTVRALPTPAPATSPPRRRLDVLVELGVVVLRGEASPALVRAVEGASGRVDLVDALLSFDEVHDVFGDDVALQALLDAW